MKPVGLFRMNVISFSIALFFLFGSALSGIFTLRAQDHASDQHDWKVYTNAKFQYALCYPHDLLAPQGESDAGDGQTFLAKDGAKLIVFGQNNVLGETLKDWFEGSTSDLVGRSGRVTYTAIKPRSRVVSGLNGSTVFYAKATSISGRFKEFILKYDTNQAAIYKPVVERLTTACFVNSEWGQPKKK
jgi:hypothetical protein